MIKKTSIFNFISTRRSSSRMVLSAIIALSCSMQPSLSYAFKENQTSDNNAISHSKSSAQVLKVGSKQHQDALTLDWFDLIPEQEHTMFDKAGMPTIDHNNTKPQQSHFGNVRSELNGTKVKIPGFVIPLEGDENTITEFLLVPYFGACIHVPPPPPNQIIYVKFKQGVPVQELWDVVYVIGTLKTELLHHDLADTAYVIEGMAVAEYNDGIEE